MRSAIARWLVPALVAAMLGCRPDVPPAAHVPRTQAVSLQQEAAAAYENGDYTRAMAKAQAAVKEDPKFYLARATLGMALAKRGDIDGALAAVTKAVELNPDFAEGHVLQGVLIEARSGVKAEAEPAYAQAVACYEAALEASPGNPKMEVDRSIAAYLRGGKMDGIVDIEKIVQKYPDYAPAKAVRELILKEDRAFFLEWAVDRKEAAAS